MRPLTVILTAPDGVRVRSGIALAAAQAAVGGVTRLHIDAPAIAALSDPATLAAVEEAHTLGVIVSLCPSGLADLALDLPPLPDAERHGLVALLAELDDAARLVVV